MQEGDWVVDGTDAICFKLVRSSDDLFNQSIFFKAEMSHQIFGEKELIYGYKELKIKLFYTASWLRIYCGIEYESIRDDVETSDIFRKIASKYGTPLLENIEVFQQVLLEEKKFIPYGDLINTFTIGSTGIKTYEIYYCTNKTEGFLDYHSRLQTLLWWFVDAVSYINIDENPWQFYLIFEKFLTEENNTGYALVGYATVYEYYAYPAHIRPRISQVLVLPPFQSKGICAKLLQTIYDHYTIKTNVLDFTAEDPCESFQRVRDFVDCMRVHNARFCSPDKLKEGCYKPILQELHTVYLINKKQARRVYEILRLKCLDVHNEEEFKRYRLDVKKRLNQPFQRLLKLIRKNVLSPDQMEMQTSNEERLARLDSMFNELVQQYMTVVSRINRQLSK